MSKTTSDVELTAAVRKMRFYSAQLFRAAPASFVVCCAALAAAVLLACVYLAGARQLAGRQNELAVLRRLPVANLPAVQGSSSPALSLPWFDSARLVEQLGVVAAETKLPIDEIGFVLEQSAQQPYLRYRVTLSVTAAYPAVRQFVDDVTSTMRHVELDSIGCVRADIALPAPTCELAFSAFFRKDAHAE